MLTNSHRLDLLFKTYYKHNMKFIKTSIPAVLTALVASFFFSSCGTAPTSTPAQKVSKPTPVKKSTPTYSSSRAALAKKILKHPKIILLRHQVSGRVDGATSYDSIAQTARGYSAKRSSYQNAPGGYTKLNIKMLETMLYMADVKGYRYRVTSIAGGSHSKGSRHYSGLGFDVDMINGVKVGAGKPYYRAFMSAARAKGATEVLGPGTKGHSRHIHMAWPR